MALARVTRQQLRVLAPWIATGAVQTLLIGLRASGTVRWPWWLILLPSWLVLLICALMLASLSMWGETDHEQP